MGMYTKLKTYIIFNPELPQYIINYVQKHIEFKLPIGQRNPINNSNASFDGVYTDNKKSEFVFDDTIGKYRLEAHGSIKNYNGEIEEFLDILEPYVESGYGDLEYDVFNEDSWEKCGEQEHFHKTGFYALKHYEEFEHPTFYYK